MEKRLVVCTSTGCIEYAPERYQNLGIEILRVHLHFKGKEYLEGVDFDPVNFYKELETLENPKENLPYTSMPTTEEISSVFENAIKNGYSEVFVVAISSGLGGTYNLIRLVANDYQDRVKINVIDSRTTCFNEGYIAIKIQELINNNVDSETILKEVDWIKANQQFIGIDGKLDYLIYNGRLKGGKAFIGKMMQICPLIHLNRDGEIVALKSIRTPKKALVQTCEYLKELLGERDEKDYILSHVYTGTSLLNELIEIEKDFGIKCNHEDVIMSPVSGCHNGPWLAGYCLTFKRREDEAL